MKFEQEQPTDLKLDEFAEISELFLSAQYENKGADDLEIKGLIDQSELD